MNMPIKFGTDGWRAVIAQEFTFDNVRVCAQATAGYLKQSGLADRGLVIGYDTRFASEDFAAAAAEVVAANGIKVFLCSKSAPTPVVSFAVTSKKAGGAIIITASHNPARYNGFKVKSADGASAPTEAIAVIEKNVSNTLSGEKPLWMPIETAVKKGLVEYCDIDKQYAEKMASLLDLNSIKQSKLRVIIDSMYGAGSGYFRSLLSGGKIHIDEINGERNPAFPGIQPEPIAVNLSNLSAAIKRRKANAGIATDGDADRVGLVDENGVFLNQLQVYALLVLYLLEVRGERGAIVKTITTTSMLDQLGKIFNVPVFETRVGFKYVAPIMLRENAMIGGEESGGYGFRGHIPERDGILAGLYFLDFMVRTGKTPSQLLQYLYSKVGEHYYNRHDIEFPENRRQEIIARVTDCLPDDIGGVKVARRDTSDGYRYILADGSWLLIRFSGTEPLLRIYAESDSTNRVQELLYSGQKIAGV
jgi:alpha-D-glucose phosphate-specific phosphoglucomutase